MPKTVAIIQARMGSSRLPGKIMKDLCGKPVLEHVVKRVQQTRNLDQVMIATTGLPGDDAVAAFAESRGLPCFRGSETDVLSRYYHAARMSAADTIVRVTSDCPLYDPHIGDTVIQYYFTHSFDIVSNAGPLDTQRTSALGTDTEVFSMACLTDAFRNADKPYQREHVTPYIYENKRNRIHSFQTTDDLSAYRLTLDTPADLKLIREIYAAMYKDRHDFYLPDIIAFLERNPELREVNNTTHQKRYNE